VSGGDELHEIVKTTAVVLRRGLVAAALGAATVVLAGGAVFLLATSVVKDMEIDGALASVRGLMGAVAFVFALALTPGATLGVVLSAFTLALEGSVRVRRALALTVRRPVVLLVPLVFVLGPIEALAFGAKLVVDAFREPLAPAGLHLFLALGVLGAGAWLLGWVVLLPAAAYVADGPSREIPLPQSRVLLVGGTPVVLGVAFLSPVVHPIVDLPPRIAVTMSGIALAVIGFLTLALSVAAYAVATAAPTTDDAL
jgi:hypothetical protein